jgi:hypothetical protein
MVSKHGKATDEPENIALAQTIYDYNWANSDYVNQTTTRHMSNAGGATANSDRVTEVHFDAAGREITQIRNNASGDQITAYAYNYCNQVISTKDPVGRPLVCYAAGQC